jgi:hypothetical protein
LGHEREGREYTERSNGHDVPASTEEHEGKKRSKENGRWTEKKRKHINIYTP